MLRSCLPPSAYIDPTVAEAEQERLFRRLWIFAGLRSAPGSLDQGLVRRIGGLWVKVCSGSSGALRAVEYAPDAAAGLSAREFHVEVLGKLVFVNLADDPMPIREQFTPEFQAMLSQSSLYFDNRYIYTHFEAKYNWKLNFENVMDYNHLPFIHAKSFNKLLDMAPVRPSEGDFAEDARWDVEAKENEPSLADLSYPSHAPMKVTEPWFQTHVRRFPAGVGKTWNWYVYPNVNYGTLQGNQFYLEQYMPLTASLTEYHLWIVTAERISKRTETTALLLGMIKAHRAVVDEDKEYLERLQLSLHSGSEHALYGRHEMPLYRAGRWYAKHVLADVGMETTSA